MINIYVLPHIHVGMFKNYNALFDFIREIENEKLLEDHPEFGHSYWSFDIYSPDRVGRFYKDKRKRLFAAAIPSSIREAYTQKLGLLEIYSGDFKKPEYVVLTPNVGLEALKKKWCLEYCAFRNFRVKEEFSGGNEP